LAILISMRTLATLLVLLMLGGTAHAQKIYKHVLPDGKVVYSDRPPEEEGAEEVELSPLQTYSAPSLPRIEPSDEEEDEEEQRYEEFKVSQPADDQTIRDNGGNVSIRLSVAPGLQGNHTIDILMDGKTLGSGKSTAITLTNVDRGSHSVRATIKDEEGNVVARTDSITFHLQRAAVGRP